MGGAGYTLYHLVREASAGGRGGRPSAGEEVEPSIEQEGDEVKIVGAGDAGEVASTGTGDSEGALRRAGWQ